MLEKSISEIKYEEILPSLLKGATKYQVRLPREFILVLKQLLYFDRYSKLTAPDLNVFTDLYLIDFLFSPMAAAYGIDLEEIAGLFMVIQQRIAERQVRAEEVSINQGTRN